MLLSVILGALLYMLVQFLWYSPFLFGKSWLRLKQVTPEEVIEALHTSTWFPESIQGIIVPAFLMSLSLNALWVVVGKFGGKVFFGITGGLFLLTVGKKYLQWGKLYHETRLFGDIGDGALFLSLACLSAFVFFVGSALY